MPDKAGSKEARRLPEVDWLQGQHSDSMWFYWFLREKHHVAIAPVETIFAEFGLQKDNESV